MNELNSHTSQAPNKKENDNLDFPNNDIQQLKGLKPASKIACSTGQVIADEPDFISYVEKTKKCKARFDKLKEYLEGNNILKYRGKKGYVFIKINNNVAETYEIDQLKGEIISRFVSEAKIDYLLDMDQKIISHSRLGYLKEFNDEMGNDDLTTCHLYFRNKILQIKKGGQKEYLTYNQLENPIWKSQIIDRDYNPVEEDELSKGDFYQFLQNVVKKNPERFISLCSAIGYLIHSKFDPSNAKAIIFYDEKVPSVKGEKNGRTGKSLIGEAIKRFKENTININGARFKRDNSFAFQKCNPDTQLLVINELPDDFALDDIFSDISENIEVEKKYDTVFDLQDVKILITTNITIKGQGSSFRDRMFEVEFSDHYSDTYTPRMDFGHLFFYDWDEYQWQLFDNFMIYCVQLYLDKGLVECKPKNLALRKLMQSEPEAIEFFNDLGSGKYYKRDLFNEFKNEYRHNDMSQAKFTRVFKDYCKATGERLVEHPGAGNRNQSFEFYRK